MGKRINRHFKRFYREREAEREYESKEDASDEMNPPTSPPLGQSYPDLIAASGTSLTSALKLHFESLGEDRPWHLQRCGVYERAFNNLTAILQKTSVTESLRERAWVELFRLVESLRGSFSGEVAFKKSSSDYRKGYEGYLEAPDSTTRISIHHIIEPHQSEAVNEYIHPNIQVYLRNIWGRSPKGGAIGDEDYTRCGLQPQLYEKNQWKISIDSGYRKMGSQRWIRVLPLSQAIHEAQLANIIEPFEYRPYTYHFYDPGSETYNTALSDQDFGEFNDRLSLILTKFSYNS